jgi:hypothetical protein
MLLCRNRLFVNHNEWLNHEYLFYGIIFLNNTYSNSGNIAMKTAIYLIFSRAYISSEQSCAAKRHYFEQEKTSNGAGDGGGEKNRPGNRCGFGCEWLCGRNPCQPLD